jgi:diketogulonate reductase-like aldo/keto reductase
MAQLVRKYGKTKEQIFFRFVKSLGIIPLTGTTSEEHMQEDLSVSSFELDPVEIGQLEGMLN